MRARIALAVSAAALAVAGCGSAAAHASAAHTPAARVAATATPSCLSQFTTWRTGGVTDLEAVAKALTQVSRADTAFGNAASAGGTPSITPVGTAASSLQAAAQTAQADLPPQCVPHLGADMSAALTSLLQAANGHLNAVQAYQQGDVVTATSDIQAANQAMDAGIVSISAAQKAMDAFTAAN